MRQVISKLGRDVIAGGLGVGFTVFEGFSFPFYLGVAAACSSLVGRNLGAERYDYVRSSIRSSRRVGRVIGLSFALIFYFGGALVAPWFSADEAVLRECLIYLQVLAFSQYFVASEAVGERVLLGAGRTRSIFAVSVPCNLLRIPLAYGLALGAGLGSPGVWWAINATTVLKATAFYFIVRSWSASLPQEDSTEPTP